MHLPVKVLHITRTKYDREQMRRVVIDERDYKIIIDIDAERLARELGEKAANNKSRKTRALSGIVVVEARPA